MFKKAKEIDAKVVSIIAAEKDLSERISLVAEEARMASKASIPTIRREKIWFERFRWFYTSQGLLVVGGRDASSNSAIIRKHLAERDLVFHADLHGSPFFVLKDDNGISEDSVQEVAQAVVSYSSAWRDGLLVGNAFWVKPEQVKKQAPSGMYLAKGSFMIEGQKNYAKNLDVKVGVGVLQRDQHLILFGGPPKSVEAHALAFVILTPEKRKASDTAKEVKSKLVSVIGTPLDEVIKRISVDDFLRVLPPSGGKIISHSVTEKNQTGQED